MVGAHERSAFGADAAARAGRLLRDRVFWTAVCGREGGEWGARAEQRTYNTNAAAAAVALFYCRIHNEPRERR